MLRNRAAPLTVPICIHGPTGGALGQPGCHLARPGRCSGYEKKREQFASPEPRVAAFHASPK